MIDLLLDRFFPDFSLFGFESLGGPSGTVGLVVVGFGV